MTNFLNRTGICNQVHINNLNKTIKMHTSCVLHEPFKDNLYHAALK